MKSFLFSTPSSASVICRLFNDGHCDWCEVIVIVPLICISLIISKVEQFFHMPTGHLYVFFGEMSIKVFCPFSDRFFFFLVV